MLLKNYYEYQAAVFSGAYRSNCKKYDGTVYTVYSSHYQPLQISETMKKLINVTNTAGVIVGDGDVHPSFEDYCLSGNLIKNIVASVSIEATGDENGCSTTANLTITNNNADSVTIKEIGILGGISTGNVALFERTVLESPITIEPGGVGQITYTIRMNFPTA